MDLQRLGIIAIIGAINLGLAALVFARKPSDRTHRAFALTVALIVTWILTAYLSDQPALEAFALHLNRATLAVAALMGASLLHFVVVFPRPFVRWQHAYRALLGGSAVVVVLTMYTPLVVADVEFRLGGTDVIPGPLLWLMMAWLGVGLVSMAVVFGAKHREASVRERAQLRFVLLGFVLFSTVSLMLGLVLPVITGTYAIAELNTFATLILVGAIAYSMVAHRFMDIRFVVMRSIGYSILLSVLSALLVLASLSVRSGLATATGLSSDAVFVVASLLALFLFQPLKRVTENVTERLFYRTTYDPDVLLSEVGTAVMSTLDQRTLATLLADRLAKGMRLSFAAVALQHNGDLEFATSNPAFAETNVRELMACRSGGVLLADELDSTSDDAARLRSSDVRVLVPLGPKEQPIGALFLGMKQSGSMFSNADMRFLENIARESAVAARNAELFAERNRRVAELTAINELASWVGANEDARSSLARALGLAVGAADADSGSIMLVDAAGEALTVEATVNLPRAPLGTTAVRLGEGISGWVAQRQQALLLVDDTDPRFYDEMTRTDIASAISAPIVYDGRVAGVLNLNRKKSRSELFDNDDLTFVISFVRQLAIALENSRLYHDLERTFLGTISALAAAVDAKDPYTYGHASWVTQYAVAIAERYGLDEGEVHTIRIASILHDIGKIGIDGAILQKPDKLTAEERDIVCRHPAIGADILASLDFLSETVPLVLFHHEQYGGGGYPSGISGTAIPLGARIIAVADAYDAMTSDRPYRRALTGEAARSELRKHAGDQFDPVIVRTFLAFLEDSEGVPWHSDRTAAPVLPFPTAMGSESASLKAPTACDARPNRSEPTRAAGTR
jgi:HD-GYP domain-containing protein (c-di-GMP phosphodiesterase class II)/uncharacterized membrane protein YhdT